MEIDLTLAIVAYTLAFLMAYTSKLIELSNTYGSYYAFIKYSPRTILYCGTYGLIGIGGYWLYKAGVNPTLLDPAVAGTDNKYLLIILSAMIIGWSAKGLSDTPLLPSKTTEGQPSAQDGFKLSIFIAFAFKDNSEQYDTIITLKQRSFFSQITQKIVSGGKTKSDFNKAVYSFLDVHPRYGADPGAGTAKFNAFMTELAAQTDLETSMRYVYRNLGYKVFKAIIKGL